MTLRERAEIVLNALTDAGQAKHRVFNEQMKFLEEQFKKVIVEEREACASLVEDKGERRNCQESELCDEIAKAIRERITAPTPHQS